MRFHPMAASSAAMTATGVSAVRAATSVPMVFATWVLTNAPTKFKMAAIKMAVHAGSTRVAMLVATALAVSWNPFVKSKDTATTIVAIRKARGKPPWPVGASAARNGMACSSIFQQYSVQHIRHVLTVIYRAFQVIVYLFPFDYQYRIRLTKKLLNAAPINVVAFVLQAVDLCQPLADGRSIAAIAQQ